MTSLKNLFQRAVEWSVIISFAAFSLVMIIQVMGRYVFNFSFTWSEEFIRYSFIWMVLLASGIAIKRRAHLGFDLITSLLPPKIQVVLHIINHILVIFFLGLFLVYGIALINVAGMTPSPSMHVPMGVVYIILPLSAFIMLIYILESLLSIFRNGENESKEEPTE